MATEVPTKIIVNCETGEQSIVPLSAEELAQREIDSAAYAAAQVEREAAEAEAAAVKASAVAKLAALGLTEAEVTSLIA